MNLAAILGLGFFSLISLLSPGFEPPSANPEFARSFAFSYSAMVRAQGNSATTQSQSQAAPAQNPGSANGTAQKQAPPTLAPKPHRRKTIYPDCSASPSTLNPLLTSGNRAKPDAQNGGSGNGASNSGKVSDNSQPSRSAQAGAAQVSSAQAKTASAKPCPPPKKVVRDGGADEPKIELLGGSPAMQASNQRSTEQITTATEENLKKIDGRELKSGEQETVNQIRQFMRQSKEALAAGDPDRAQSLATKAKLLSDELVGP